MSSVFRDKNYFEKDVDEKVKDSIYESLYVYINKLQSKYYNVGLEAAFQFYYAQILKQILDLKIMDSRERFDVLLEDNIKIENKNDYVDAVIRYTKGDVQKKYCIEFKFKKITDSAPDLGNIESYKDLYMLSQQKIINKIDGCYYIFLTDLKTYLNESKSGTRAELPMHDGAAIIAGRNYNVTGNAARKAFRAFPDGVNFEKDYAINYQSFDIEQKPYWFFIVEV